MNFFDQSSIVPHNLLASEVVLNILLAFLLSSICAGTYVFTSRSSATNRSLIHTLIILSMVIAFVMMVIGGNLARAFSLVGALSLIRFRTVVRDNRDIAFVFFSLAAGMAAATGLALVAISGTLAIAMVILAIDRFSLWKKHDPYLMLRFSMIPAEGEPVFYKVFDKHLADAKLQVVKLVQLGQMLEYTYHVQLSQAEEETAFITALSAEEGVDRIVLSLVEGQA